MRKPPPKRRHSHRRAGDLMFVHDGNVRNELVDPHTPSTTAPIDVQKVRVVQHLLGEVQGHRLASLLEGAHDPFHSNEWRHFIVFLSLLWCTCFVASRVVSERKEVLLHSLYQLLALGHRGTHRQKLLEINRIYLVLAAAGRFFSPLTTPLGNEPRDLGLLLLVAQPLHQPRQLPRGEYGLFLGEVVENLSQSSDFALIELGECQLLHQRLHVLPLQSVRDLLHEQPLRLPKPTAGR
mmetsp:Transcript_24136/g.42716  ORF Transcript_24136/g.42716 Transcript_24136/m.42716 type:complete len:237 (+) Transcript_24136:277-987(+)